MGEPNGYELKDLKLYMAARDFRRQIYALVNQLPAFERYCLAAQMRRAGLSVSNNIAEGHGRWHFRENIQFCRIARGSVEELMDDLDVCEDQQYGSADLRREAMKQATSLVHQINGYIRYLNSKVPTD